MRIPKDFNSLSTMNYSPAPYSPTAFSAIPYNILIFMTRKSGISHMEFKNHYENTHMPLLQFYGGPYFPKHHSRHYLQFDKNDEPVLVLSNNKTGFDYDVIAESDLMMKPLSGHILQR
jgi:hypothetical protein